MTACFHAVFLWENIEQLLEGTKKLLKSCIYTVNQLLRLTKIIFVQSVALYFPFKKKEENI